MVRRVMVRRVMVRREMDVSEQIMLDHQLKMIHIQRLFGRL
jgi:hypothetical protein